MKFIGHLLYVFFFETFGFMLLLPFFLVAWCIGAPIMCIIEEYDRWIARKEQEARWASNT